MLPHRTLVINKNVIFSSFLDVIKKQSKQGLLIFDGVE